MTVASEKPRRQYSPFADFRSDVVTIPTDEMFEAMKKAHLGDDVYDESETTQELENHIAQMTGKEAGLFCSSGTQGNQICLRTHLYQPPYSILCDARAHIINYEAGGIAMFSQAMSSPIHPKNGSYITAEEVKKNLIGDNIHFAPTKIISLENTLSGAIFPIGEIRMISKLARETGIAIHLDGARLWEASAATGISMSEYGQCFDTMSLCLSKGIGAPVGTVIVGTKTFIQKAKWFRKMMGGGMRQVGILSGAARFALDTHFPNGLAVVHKRAARVAKYALDNGLVLRFPADTNMVWLDFEKCFDGRGINEEQWDNKAKDLGATTHGERLVFHHQITDAGEHIAMTLIQFFVDRDRERVSQYGHQG